MPSKPPADSQSDKLIRRVRQELIDDYDEELEMEREDWEMDAAGELRRPGGKEASRSERNRYFRELFRLQGELVKMHDWIVASGHRLVIVFEGRDAAGKGGAIRRLTSAMDPRDYRVVPVAKPTPEEKHAHYLWRFWREVPRDGRVTVFDRSWYGRVLVERIEKFCSDADWMRAYSEINDFENQLAQNGAIVAKFWLQISKEEQYKRFKLRERTRFKRFKITEEDWRNRGKIGRAHV